jgi:lipopolysaccharide export system protein LptC
MTDIHVVPKGRSNRWLWIIAVLIVVGLLAWLMGRSSGTRTTTRRVPPGLYAAQAGSTHGHTGVGRFSGRGLAIA